MAKRFTATEKWLDPWFCALSLVDRLFWMFILDNCDHAGIWQVNPLLVSTYFPGYELDPKRFGDRVQIITPQKWFIPKFIEFQYGTLNENSKPHLGVIRRLEKEGLYKPLGNPLVRVQDKDKEKLKKRGDARGEKQFTPPAPEEVRAYGEAIGFPVDGEHFCAYYEARGWQFKRGQPMKSWKHAVVTWKKNGFTGNGSTQSPEMKGVPEWMKNR